MKLPAVEIIESHPTEPSMRDELLDHPHLAHRIEFAAAIGARRSHPEDAGLH